MHKFLFVANTPNISNLVFLAPMPGSAKYLWVQTSAKAEIVSDCEILVPVGQALLHNNEAPIPKISDRLDTEYATLKVELKAHDKTIAGEICVAEYGEKYYAGRPGWWCIISKSQFRALGRLHDLATGADRISALLEALDELQQDGLIAEPVQDAILQRLGFETAKVNA